MNHEEMALELHKARLAGKPIPQWTLKQDLNVDGAYQIQNYLVQKALEEGDKVVGYKMGLTSKAKQRDVQVFDTIHGVLLNSFEIGNAKFPTANTIHPRVEPEIAVVLKKDADKILTNHAEVLGILEGIYPALEVVDSRYENFKFQLADVIADNTSACGYLIGKTNYLSRLEFLNLLGVIVKKNQEILETGTPAAVLGDPLLSVLSLIERVTKQDVSLKKGMVILTGGITTSVPFSKGDLIEVDWPDEVLKFKAI